MPTVPSSPMTVPQSNPIGQPSPTLFAIAAIENKRRAQKTESILGDLKDKK